MSQITELHLEIVPNYASIDRTNRSPRIVSVQQDETRSGAQTIYLFDGIQSFFYVADTPLVDIFPQ